MSIGDGLATLTQPVAHRVRLRDQRRTRSSGTARPVTADGRRLQPQARRGPQGRRLLRRDVRPGEVDRRPRATRPFKITLNAARLLAARRAVRRRPARSSQKKFVEAKGKDFGTVSGRHDVLGPVQARLLEDRPGRQGRPERRLLGHHAAQAEVHEHDPHRRPRRRDPHRRPARPARSTAATPSRCRTLGQLQTDPNVKVYQGAPVRRRRDGHQRDQGPARRPEGPPGDLLGARPQGHHQHASPRAPATSRTRSQASGTWGYAPRHRSRPATTPCRRWTRTSPRPRTSPRQADVAGQTITIGTSSGIPSLNAEALAFKAAAEAIGLKVELNERQPVQLHQLLHRPQGVGLGRRVRHHQLRRLRRPGGALQDDRAARAARRTSAAGTNPEVTTALERGPQRGRPGQARAVRRRRRRRSSPSSWCGSRLVAPNNVARHEQERHRRAGDVRLHVRSVGGLPRRHRP